MLQEMRIRNYSERSIRNYICCLSQLSVYYHSSPDLLTIEQIKSYLHYCVTVKQSSASTINQIIGAVRILFTDVLQRPWEPIKLKRARKDKKLPVAINLHQIEIGGGTEYCWTTIDKALDSLTWSKRKDDLKLIIIAGNESFTQEEIDTKKVINKARKLNVAINTIYCSATEDKIGDEWRKAADQ